MNASRMAFLVCWAMFFLRVFSDIIQIYYTRSGRFTSSINLRASEFRHFLEIA